MGSAYESHKADFVPELMCLVDITLICKSRVEVSLTVQLDKCIPWVCAMEKCCSITRLLIP